MKGRKKAEEFLRLEALKLQARAGWIRKALKDCPPPWRNITAEWNLAQAEYFLRKGRHYHGPLKGCAWRSSKHCAVLIVQDKFQGEPITINPKTWCGEPDYYDFHKVVARPDDDRFRGRASIAIDERIECEPGFADMIVAAVNAMYAPASEESP